MVSYAQDSDKQRLIHIWKVCFPHDSDAFVEMYFHHKFNPDHTLIFRTNDGVIAATLQMLPYGMNFYGQRVSCAYISGAATLPAYRNQQMMKQLLIAALREMKKKNVALTVLFTQEDRLASFYGKYGYTHAFEHQIEQIQNDAKMPENALQTEEVNLSNVRTAFDFFNRYGQSSNLHICKTFEDFTVILKDYLLANGKVLLCKAQGSIVGLIFCLQQHQELIVKKLILTNKSYRQAVIQTLTVTCHVDTVRIFEPSQDAASAITKGMARIVNPWQLLRIYACHHPHISLIFGVEDEILSENNFTVQIKDGLVRIVDTHNMDCRMNIKRFTQVLLGYQTNVLTEPYSVFEQQHPYMDLMLE
jgi:predicted acetyltransferase